MAYIFIWIFAIVWHHWRILTLRPAFSALSDTFPAALPFLIPFFATEMLRYGILSPEFNSELTLMGGAVFLLKTLGSAFASWIIVLICFERKARSSSLGSVVLGVFTIGNTIVMLLYAFDLSGLEVSIVELACTIASIFTMLSSFQKEPAAVQAAGYRLGDVSEKVNLISNTE